MKNFEIKRTYKLLAVLLVVLFALAMILPACNGSDDGKISVVCTIFPEYDWTREILGDEAENVELTLLLKNGVDLHSYQPSVADIATISTCDLFLHVGGESEGWVDDALKNSLNENMVVLDLLDVLDEAVKEEETVEGMQEEHEEESGEAELDEHVWLSLKNAKTICTHIATALGQVDSDNSAKYAANAAAYAEKLDELDGEYSAAVEAAPCDTLVFGDRFPFRYLVDDYGLNYYAAFVGCSAETEASFETIVFLAGKLNELALPAVCKIDGSSSALAETVRSNTTAKNQTVVTLDSMQSTTESEIAAGMTYLSVMTDNLAQLKRALGVAA